MKCTYLKYTDKPAYVFALFTVTQIYLLSNHCYFHSLAHYRQLEDCKEIYFLRGFKHGK